jgi:hypothetical protein
MARSGARTDDNRERHSLRPSHWEGFIRPLDDGPVEIDSKTVERSMKTIALNRNNTLFTDSDKGSANWAIIAALIETCELNGVIRHTRKG